MDNERLITVAIHTYDKAIALKNLLEHEGVNSVLQNVNLTNPVVSSGVRVRIKECDLPLALRIIENYEIFVDNAASDVDDSKTILVPTDFSDYSLEAARLAFNIANRHQAKIRLVHSFINPALAKRLQLADTLSFEIGETQEIEKRLVKDARAKMDALETQLKLMIKNGEIPPVKFSSEILEGVPEDVINEVAKTIVPMLIVMGTRGADRKESELIGSVTAELLDSCRFPVITVPETSPITKLANITSIIFFSNLEQEDILAMESLCRFFRDLPVKITIVHVPGKKEKYSDAVSDMKRLVEYCRQHYPAFEFSMEALRLDNIIADFKSIANQYSMNLIALPNKKRNVFFRFFNPSLAHRLLLKSDVPMIVIPV